MHYFSLYLEFIKIRIQSMIEYRKAFIGHALAQAASYGADFLLIWIMIDQFKKIGQWGPYEVLFLYSLNLISYALAGFFLFKPCYDLTEIIRTGEFDQVLVKPVNHFLYLISSKFSYGYLSHITISLIVLTICINKLGIVLTPFNIIFLLLILLGAALIQGSALIFTSVPSFWLIKNNNLMGILLYDLKNFIRYPISIYNKAIQILLTIFIPYAFINFYPAQLILDKNDFMIFHPVFQYLTPVVGVILFIGAYKFWNFGIDRYKSTGS